jgi:hypothetical protein
VERAAISEREDPARLLTNLHQGGGKEHSVSADREGSGRERSLRRGWGLTAL